MTLHLTGSAALPLSWDCAAQLRATMRTARRAGATYAPGTTTHASLAETRTYRNPRQARQN